MIKTVLILPYRVFGLYRAVVRGFYRGLVRGVKQGVRG